MSLTAEALAEEILRVDPAGMTEALELSRKLLPFINRNIAAGQQGAGELVSQWRRLADETSTNDPMSRRHAMTLRQCAAALAACLATPQPAPLSDNPQPLPDNPHLSDKGAVPLPATVLTQRSEPGNIPRPLCTVADAIRYGDDREAAARGDHVHAGGWQGLLDQVLRDTAKELGCEPDNEVILETIHALKAAGRADAVQADEGRHDFEKWAAKRWGLSLNRWDDSGEYTSHLTRDWWQCWTESRKAMLAAAPIPQQPAADGDDWREKERLSLLYLRELLDGFKVELGTEELLPPATYLQTITLTGRFQPGHVSESTSVRIREILSAPIHKPADGAGKGLVYQYQTVTNGWHDLRDAADAEKYKTSGWPVRALYTHHSLVADAEAETIERLAREAENMHDVLPSRSNPDTWSQIVRMIVRRLTGSQS